MIKVALVGNPNTGKSTIFNALTGIRQHTGNWPGVTVEKKVGYFEHKGYEFEVVDLPGIYSLSSYQVDEKIARDFIVKEKPHIVVYIVDSVNIERGMYLLLQLLELEQNIVVVFNMMDIALKKGIEINVKTFEKILNVRAVKAVGTKQKGIDRLKDKIIEAYNSPLKGFILRYDDFMEDAISRLEGILERFSFDYPPRFIALRLLEDDPEFLETVIRSECADEVLSILDELKKRVYDTATYLAEKRYGFIHGLIKECVSKKMDVSKKMTLTDKIDSIIANRFLGIPLFLFIMFIAFWIIFNFGLPFTEFIQNLFQDMEKVLESFFLSNNYSPVIVSFITKGIVSGVGIIITFVPNIFLFYIVFGIMEDSGYMPRAAFVMDKLMHTLGLHGKSFIPMILGFGCNVPAVLATRTLESKKDRVLTVLLIPFMSCSARLPVYILFVQIFFERHKELVIVSLYIMGIVLGVISSAVLKRFFFPKEDAPLIMELPLYRLPSLKNVFLYAVIKTKMFLRKAGTIILLFSLIIWFLASFPFGVKYASSNSLIGKIGEVLAPIYSSSGFGFKEAVIALMFGVVAKELIIGSFGTLLGPNMVEILSIKFTPLSAYSFLVATLISVPCVATMGAIRKELGYRWMFFSFFYMLILGWLFSTVVYQIGRVFYGG